MVALFQNERRVPVSFSFPIVWSAPLSEKKLRVAGEERAVDWQPLFGRGAASPTFND